MADFAPNFISRNIELAASDVVYNLHQLLQNAFPTLEVSRMVNTLIIQKASNSTGVIYVGGPGMLNTDLGFELHFAAPATYENFRLDSNFNGIDITSINLRPSANNLHVNIAVFIQ